MKEEAQAVFFTKQQNEEYVSSFIKDAGVVGIDVVPLQNYKIKFYGEGKLVCLERTDIVGYPVLIGEYIAEGKKNKQAVIFYIYFHRPYPGAQLEIIR